MEKIKKKNKGKNVKKNKVVKKKNSDDKKVTILRSISIVFLLIFLAFIFAFIYIVTAVKSVNIKKVSYRLNNNELDIIININNESKKTVFCSISEEETSELQWQEAKDNKCNYTVDIKDYNIYLKTEDNESDPVKLSKYINDVIDYKLEDDVIYLAPGETTAINQKNYISKRYKTNI